MASGQAQFNHACSCGCNLLHKSVSEHFLISQKCQVDVPAVPMGGIPPHKYAVVLREIPGYPFGVTND